MFAVVMLLIILATLAMLPKFLHGAYLIVFGKTRDPRRIKLIRKIRVQRSA